MSGGEWHYGAISGDGRLWYSSVGGEERRSRKKEVVETMEKEVVTPAPEEPKYGGTLTIAQDKDVDCWDEIVQKGAIATSGLILRETNDNLWSGNLARGPAGGYGTNETDWDSNTDVWELKSRRIAERWELPREIHGILGLDYLSIHHQVGEEREKRSIKWELY
ncbi:hypothetical protein ACFLVC_05430 [Chloroflexota bacterium]